MPAIAVGGCSYIGYFPMIRHALSFLRKAEQAREKPIEKSKEYLIKECSCSRLFVKNVGICE